MKLSLKSLFPSSLFNKITLKAAILVGLVLFYLVIILSSSREGIETTGPSSETPKTMVDIQNMLDSVSKPSTKPNETKSATKSVKTPTPTSNTEEPTEEPTTEETPTPTKDVAVETPVSPSKTPYATY